MLRLVSLKSKCISQTHFKILVTIKLIGRSLKNGIKCMVTWEIVAHENEKISLIDKEARGALVTRVDYQLRF